MKLCECGCGEPTQIALETNRPQGYIKGQPKRFVRGHNLRGIWTGRKHTEDSLRRMSESTTGERSPNWKGGMTTINGRRLIRVSKDHPLANTNSYALEHRLVFSSAIGRFLGKHEHIHHINEDPLDNRVENLLLMDASRHKRLHMLMRRMPSDEAITQVMGMRVVAEHPAATKHGEVT